MKRKKNDGNVVELQLFHGTNEEIVDAICKYTKSKFEIIVISHSLEY
jgi:hypothetical protein